MTQWDLLLLSVHCVREVMKTGNVWKDSFKAVNMHPNHTLPLKAWLKKLEPVLRKGKQCGDEGDTSPESVLPDWHKKWPQEKKDLAMRTIDEGGGWSDPSCLSALTSVCGLEMGDL